MNTFQKDVIALIRAALSGQKQELSDEFDMTACITPARKHNIAAMLYHGAVLCNVPKTHEAMEKLLLSMGKALFVSEQQMFALEQLTGAFDENGISYMPLKGSILKSLYPKPEMRTMGDADILIRLDQYEEITKILEQQKYSFQYESDHELVWRNKSLLLELHKSVMTSYNKDLYQYFDTGWDFARRTSSDSSRYEQSNEDFYIYLFVHFTKHYRISGIGIKHLTDLWVYRNAYPDMDYNYIHNELKKMKLHEFYGNVVKTLDVWFCGAEGDERTDLITNLIFSSGQYGKSDMAVINRILRDTGAESSVSRSKTKRLFGSLFLPYHSMCTLYPCVKKFPPLLPVMWVVRLVDILISRRKKITAFKERMQSINRAHLDENRKALQFVGLSFEHEE